MAFQIKDAASISASCLNGLKATTRKITDFNIGSVVRAMIDAVAAELDELYQQMFIGLREAIPVSVYNSFDFEALAATSASGLVRVTVTAGTPVLISTGATFTVSGNSTSYVSLSDVTVATGATYVDAPVAASTPGVAGNLTAGSAFTISPAPDRFVSASNIGPFINGRDAETDDERKVRFNAFIAALTRGTVAALTYGLKTTVITDSIGNVIERVASAAVVEPWLTDSTQPISLVNCYVHNGVGSTSSALVTQARAVVYGYYDANGNAVPGWKAAGVQVNVYAATEDALPVTGVVGISAGYDHATILAIVQQVIFTYLVGLDIGVSALKAEMVKRVMELDGVYNFMASALVDETTALSSHKIMPGTITLTAE